MLRLRGRELSDTFREVACLGLLSLFGRRDRRVFPRRPVHFDVMYGQGEDLTLTTAVDMSEGGLSFLSKTPIPEGTELDMRLIISHENQEDTIEVKSKVVRNENKRTAVSFEDIKRSDLERIQDYIEHLPAAAQAAQA